MDTVSHIITIAKMTLRPRVPILGCLSIPFGGFLNVLMDTVSYFITIPKMALCPRIPILGCLSIPLDGFLNVLMDTVSHFITVPKIVLRHRFPIFCCFSIPFDSFLNVFMDTVSHFITIPKIALRRRILLHRGFLIPPDSLCVIPGYPLPMKAAPSHFELRIRISHFCRDAVAAHRTFHIAQFLTRQPHLVVPLRGKRIPIGCVLRFSLFYPHHVV